MIVQELTNDLISKLSLSPYVVLDCETTKTETPDGRYLIGLAFGIVDLEEGFETYYVPVRHDTSLGIGLGNSKMEILESLNYLVRNKDVVFHNAKFDVQILEQEGFVFEGQIWDTMLMAHIVDENHFNYGLKELAKLLLDLEESATLKKAIKSIERGIPWNEIPPMMMSLYAEWDVALTYKLYKHLLPQLLSQDLVSYHHEQIKFSLVLKAIEARGLLFDRGKSVELAESCERRMLAIQQELGFDPAKRNSVLRKLYDPPPLGLGLTVLKRGLPSKSFPQGSPTIDDGVLSSYSHPTCGLILEYRGLQKACSTWYRGFLRASDQAGRLHPSFKQHGTVTGRLSCENPNLQQIPRDQEHHPVKTLFHAPKGFELWEFDYSQIELRLAACYADEPELLEAFRSGEDIHQTVADSIGVSRHLGKTINFLMLFGGGWYKLSDTAKITQARAKEIVDAYYKRYPKLILTAWKAEDVANQKKQISNWAGRVRHFMFSSEHKKAFNSVIQGGAFEIVKRGMINVHNEGYAIVNTVHDSIWVEIPREKVQQSCLDISALLADWTKEEFPIYFPVDAKRLDK